MPIHRAKYHQERAEEAIRQAAYDMGLPGWLYITVAFDPKHADGEDGRVACTTTCDWEYRQVSFLWNLPIVATLTEQDLHDTALHELVHALIAPLWDCVREEDQENKHIGKLNELATENVTRVIRHIMEVANERTVSTSQT